MHDGVQCSLVNEGSKDSMSIIKCYTTNGLNLTMNSLLEFNNKKEIVQNVIITFKGNKIILNI